MRAGENVRLRVGHPSGNLGSKSVEKQILKSETQVFVIGRVRYRAGTLAPFSVRWGRYWIQGRSQDGWFFLKARHVGLPFFSGHVDRPR